MEVRKEIKVIRENEIKIDERDFIGRVQREGTKVETQGENIIKRQRKIIKRENKTKSINLGVIVNSPPPNKTHKIKLITSQTINATKSIHICIIGYYTQITNRLNLKTKNIILSDQKDAN